MKLAVLLPFYYIKVLLPCYFFHLYTYPCVSIDGKRSTQNMWYKLLILFLILWQTVDSVINFHLFHFSRFIFTFKGVKSPLPFYNYGQHHPTCHRFSTGTGSGVLDTHPIECTIFSDTSTLIQFPELYPSNRT